MPTISPRVKAEPLAEICLSAAVLFVEVLKSRVVGQRAEEDVVRLGDATAKLALEDLTASNPSK